VAQAQLGEWANGRIQRPPRTSGAMTGSGHLQPYAAWSATDCRAPFPVIALRIAGNRLTLRGELPKLAAIRPMTRTARPVDNTVFAFGRFQLYPAERLLLREDKPVRLGSRAFEILVTLVERAGETVLKGQLIDRVWPNMVVDESGLRVHVAGLRKALGDGREATASSEPSRVAATALSRQLLARSSRPLHCQANTRASAISRHN